MGFFDDKESLSRRELRERLKRDKGRIPETGGKKFSRGEREKLSREAFSWRHGSQISKRDVESAVRDLEREKKNAETPAEEREIDEKIRYLESQM